MFHILYQSIAAPPYSKSSICFFPQSIAVPPYSKSSICFFPQLLGTLKKLPITNKTILKDSKILPTVQKWSSQLLIPAAESTDTGRDTDTQSEPSTPKVVPPHPTQSSSQDSAPSTPHGGDMPFDGLPHKKRRLLMRLQEEVSSSDSELSDSSKSKKNNDDTTGRENNKGTTSHDEASKVESLSETSRDATDTAKSQLDGIIDMAGELLTNWEGLKESFKIPKLKVEERKKREQELGKRESRHS